MKSRLSKSVVFLGVVLYIYWLEIELHKQN